MLCVVGKGAWAGFAPCMGSYAWVFLDCSLDSFVRSREGARAQGKPAGLQRGIAELLVSFL